MSKEKLKKEAEESAKKFFGKPTDLVDLDNLRIFKNGYLAGAEPREKRIEELENIICTHEYYQNGYKQGKLEESRKSEVEIFEIQGEVELRDVRIYDLNKKVNELEQQIEKMKKYEDFLNEKHLSGDFRNWLNRQSNS